MRQAVAQATHHAAHRQAFGKLLSDQPLMVNVLADLAVESEATTVLMMRLAASFDREEDAPFRRIALAVAKYWCTKRAIGVVAEGLECLGGNGYVEESIMPRLYREAPLNSIWEGSGNVNALDVLRAMHKEPATLEAFFGEIDPDLGAAAIGLRREMSDLTEAEPRARWIVERMAVLLQASLLLKHGDPDVAGVFVDSRLNGSSRQYGALRPSGKLKAIVERARPLVN